MQSIDSIEQFFIPLIPLWPVIVVLILRKSVTLSALKWAILPLATKAGWSLQYCHN